jgi:glycosyltransferase involved in cell wall biosynthesis
MKHEPHSYWVIITVKNGESVIKKTLDSIISQSLKPSLVCIINDGSTDSTPDILSEIKKENNDIIHIINLPDEGYDIRRIVHNWNKACEYVKNLGNEYDYLLISADDSIYPESYVEKLVESMKKESSLVIASGTRGLKASDYMSFPEGSGRMIRMSFFKKIGFYFPPYYGYESWILYKALQLGYKIKKLNDLEYKHSRLFGSGHQFVEYGPMMRCLGYHPLFVIARVLRNIFIHNTGISARASFRMLLDYIQKNKWKNDPYFHYFELDLRQFIRALQKKRLLSKFRI